MSDSAIRGDGSGEGGDITPGLTEGEIKEMENSITYGLGYSEYHFKRLRPLKEDGTGIEMETWARQILGDVNLNEHLRKMAAFRVEVVDLDRETQELQKTVDADEVMAAFLEWTASREKGLMECKKRKLENIEILKRRIVNAEKRQEDAKRTLLSFK